MRVVNVHINYKSINKGGITMKWINIPESIPPIRAVCLYNYNDKAPFKTWWICNTINIDFCRFNWK